MVADRLHYIDRCRAMLMLMGIPYHAAMLYSPGWGPAQHVTSRFCDVVSQAITQFRMPAFFLIAGYFAAMLLSRRDRATWFTSRLQRLGIPLISASLTLIPIQLFIYAIGNAGSFGQAVELFQRRIVTPSPAWISHLWFLYDLIIYSAIVAVAWPIVARLVRADQPRAWARWPFLTMLLVIVVVALPLSLFNPLLGTTFWGSVVNRLLRHSVFFAVGAVLYLSPPFFERWVTWRWQRAVSALVIIAAATALAVSRDHYRPALLASAGAAISGAWLVLAAMKRWGDAPNKQVKLLVDASLTIYLLHHPIIVALGLVTARISLPPAVEWAAVSVATGALSFGGYLLLRRVPILFFCFNGQLPPSRSGRPATQRIAAKV